MGTPDQYGGSPESTGRRISRRVALGALVAAFAGAAKPVHVPKREEHLQHFNLATTHLVKTGIATCDFQGDPNPIDGTPRTDWEQAIQETRDGVRKTIRGDVTKVPHFRKYYKTHIDHVADDLNNSVFRMSLDFGRLCPKEGVFDKNLMDEYIRIIGYCRKKGLDPMVTMHHWPMPLSFCTFKGNNPNGKMEKGAWEHPEILKHFRYYMTKVMEYFLNPNKIRKALKTDPDQNFRDEEIEKIIDEGVICKKFITINEPMMHLISPYILGDFPPYRTGAIFTGPAVLDKVGEAHKIAYDTIHEAVVNSRCYRFNGHQIEAGAAYNFIEFVGKNTVTDNVAERLDQTLNWDTVNLVEGKRRSDVIGAQYYTAFGVDDRHILEKAFGYTGDEREYGDHPGFGHLDPDGMRRVLRKLEHQYPDVKKRVTEFGFADNSDKKRPFLIMETIDKILQAKEEGVNIDMVILWTLFNNVEWTVGTDVHLGLYNADGTRLISDDGNSISSREVWGILSKYLNNPNEETKRAVLELHKKAKAQYEATIRLR